MADKELSTKTKFAIDIRFDTNVPVSHPPMKSIQKGAAAGKKAVAVTDRRTSCPLIEVKWEEVTDPIAKMVKLSIKELKITILFHCSIQYSKEIDKKSDCYKHIVAHEKLHVASRKASLNKYKKVMTDFIKAETWPKMDEFAEVKTSQAKKIRAEAFKKIEKAVTDASAKVIYESDKASQKIDSATEDAKTQSLCAMFV